MRTFDQTHITFLIVTIAFYGITMFAISKMPRWAQNIMFGIGALICFGGLFFRYAMDFKFTLDFDFKTFAIQMMQVCNFNAILVLLMLVPKFELARQYSIFFSLAAACTYMLSLPSNFASHNWYDVTILNSWLNHTFAIGLPLWMFAAGRLKPDKKYIWSVTLCVIAYFTVAYGCIEWLHSTGALAQNVSFSFIHDPGKIPFLVWFYKLIPMPYFYLFPLIPIMFGYFWVLAWFCRNRKAQPFAKKR
ncbi:MAG: YwaF family protein [Clostridia bacterium]|nr:YwaF family protein [Clostridia bacterium]